jgi:hypothetical protein
LTACSLVLTPSFKLAALLASLHALALGTGCNVLSGLPLLLVTGGILLSAGWTVSDALGRLPTSVQSMELQEDGTGRWRDRQGREHPVRAIKTGWVGPALMVLGLSSSRWRTRWLVLLPDSAPADGLRGLRVWLKWRPA